MTCQLDHDHARRDGRPCAADQCHAGHRAELNDLSRLQADVDACLSFLVQHQDEWQPRMTIDMSHEERSLTIIAVPRDAA